MARGNLQAKRSSGAFPWPFLHGQKLHQAELIPAPPAAEFYRIHALTYEVQAQAPRADIFKRASAHLLRIRGHSAIFQYDFKSISGLAISRHMNPAEGCLDGLFGIPMVGVANDIGQRFIDGKNYGTAVWLRKSQLRREFS
jgi:hypothetical protein